MTDRFDQLKPIKGQFIQMDAVGDTFKGTLIGIRANVPGKFGVQTVYDFKSPDGSLWMYGTKNSIFISQMRNVKLGQLVKLELTELRDTNKGNMAKIVTPFADSSIVDEDWIKEQELVDTQNAINAFDTTEDEVQIESDEIPFVADDEVKILLGKINTLALQKLGVTDPNKIQEEIMKATNLPFIPLNLSKIVTALEAMPNKA